MDSLSVFFNIAIVTTCIGALVKFADLLWKIGSSIYENKIEKERNKQWKKQQ